MNKISCDMCLDLIPLVRDGVAGADSQAAVEAHLAECESCRVVFAHGNPECDSEKALLKTIKNVRRAVLAAMIGIVLLGIVLCELVMQGSSVFFLLLCWLVFISARFALRRDKSWMLRIISLCLAVALTLGIGWVGNEVFGNPITKDRAAAHIAGYLEGAFGDSDYYIERIRYDWSGSYYGCIHSESDPELEFYIAYRDGEIIYDTYREHVLDIWE